MPKEQQCPSCGATYQVPEAQEGTLRCRFCDYPLKVDDSGSGGARINHPRLCCRCGDEHPSETWPVEFTNRVIVPLLVAVYSRETRFSTTVPLCGPCSDAMERIGVTRHRITIYSMLACGLAAFTWGWWDAHGLGGGAILAIVGAIFGWPLGSVLGWMANGMMGGGLGGIDGNRIYFYNDRFQEEFARLNPWLYPEGPRQESRQEPGS
jgi:hypothetical protein